jgi:hypothetical protein
MLHDLHAAVTEDEADAMDAAADNPSFDGTGLPSESTRKAANKWRRRTRSSAADAALLT